MSNLISRLRARCEFDAGEAKDSAQYRWDTWEKGAHVVTFQVEAARWENARLKPLIEKLLAVVEGAEMWARADASDPHGGVALLIALAALEEEE